jgi:hypothetical protein
MPTNETEGWTAFGISNAKVEGTWISFPFLNAHTTGVVKCNSCGDRLEFDVWPNSTFKVPVDVRGWRITWDVPREVMRVECARCRPPRRMLLGRLGAFPGMGVYHVHGALRLTTEQLIEHLANGASLKRIQPWNQGQTRYVLRCCICNDALREHAPDPGMAQVQRIECRCCASTTAVPVRVASSNEVLVKTFETLLEGVGRRS